MDDSQSLRAQDGALVPEGSLFERLREACAEDWQSYVEHDFVRQLGEGTLPEACFSHYLKQDYVFLIHFARAYALAVYKSEDLEEMRQAAATLDALINSEMHLHVAFCADWDLTEADMAAVPEAPENMAYTRYVLERGLSGDLLDLLVALAPCVVGYGVIGARLAKTHQDTLSENPYRAWIETYAGDDYQQVARAAVAQLDRVAEKRHVSQAEDTARWDSMVSTFRSATRLEAGFWGMGLTPPEGEGPPR